MAKNNLTPQQDVATRQFYVLVALKLGEQASSRALKQMCLDLLNYDLTQDGRFIEKDAGRSYRWGTKPEDIGGPCEWVDDYKRAIKQGGKNASNNHKDTFTPGGSEPTTGAKTRKALLREDV